jgi:hypothetical protein
MLRASCVVWRMSDSAPVVSSPVHHLFGGAPAGGDLDVGKQALLVVVEAVATGRREGDAEAHRAG